MTTSGARKAYDEAHMKRALELDKTVSSGHISSYMELIKYLVVLNTSGITLSAAIPSVLKQVNGAASQSYLSLSLNFIGAAFFIVGLYFSGMCWMAGLIYFKKLGIVSRNYISLLAVRSNGDSLEDEMIQRRATYRLFRMVRRSEYKSFAALEELKFHLKYAFVSVIVGSVFIYAAVVDNTKTIFDYIDAIRMVLVLVYDCLLVAYLVVYQNLMLPWL